MKNIEFFTNGLWNVITNEGYPSILSIMTSYWITFFLFAERHLVLCFSFFERHVTLHIIRIYNNNIYLIALIKQSLLCLNQIYIYRERKLVDNN